MDPRPAAVVSRADLGPLATRVLAADPRCGAVRVVAVDGGAGAGKSSLARDLAERLRGRGAAVAVVRTDLLLDGWDGQFSFWDRLREQVLAPLAAGREAAPDRYDWDAGRFDGTLVVPAADVVVVEGVSAIAACGDAASTTVWVELDRTARERRWTERDGTPVQPEWSRWLDREDAFFTPPPVADVTVSTADGPPEPQQRATRTAWENPWMRVREDEVEFAGGHVGSYGVVERPDFVLVAAAERGGLWLVEQYRYAVRARDWEFCQGGWPPGRTGAPRALAAAELREELGLTAERLDHVGRLTAAVGYSGQRYDVFLATGLTVGDTAREVTESDMRHAWFPEAQVRAMVADGALTDAHSLAALALLDARADALPAWRGAVDR